MIFNVSKVVTLTGAAVFAGMLVSGASVPAEQAEAKVNNQTLAGTASSWTNFMNPVWDNGTNVQVFKTDYGYGAWATDSNGNIIGDEPVARTAYYIPTLGVKNRDSSFGDFVAAYEVNVNTTPSIYGFGGGNTIQTYYSEADFATNVTDHFDHFANALPLWQNDFTVAAALDDKGKSTTPYIFGFDFGDYNPNYIEFVGTTWSPKNQNIVSNDQVGVWTGTKLPDFSVYGDVTTINGLGQNVYVPEVYMNPVFEDANALAYSNGFWGDNGADDILYNYDWNESGQVIPNADGTFDVKANWGSIADRILGR